MRKALRWTGIVLGGLVGLVVLAVLGLYFVGSRRIGRRYDIQPASIVIPSDAAALEAGRHWTAILCVECHGEDLSGDVLIDDSTIGYVPTPNLTAGAGGVASNYGDADWVRALRHGVNNEGRALLAMPSANYYYMSDGDLGELIAYLKSVPPVDNDLGGFRLTFTAKVLLAAGVFGEAALPAEIIDHSGPRPAAPPAGATVEYGDYLVRVVGCRDCHGKELAGGAHPEPGAPPGPNLTPGGSFRAWNLQAFIGAARNLPNGYMPWKDLGAMTDPELEAMFSYLQSLPAREDAIK
jgi:mono/diheme cytochrome c family protein